MYRQNYIQGWGVLQIYEDNCKPGGKLGLWEVPSRGSTYWVYNFPTDATFPPGILPEHFENVELLGAPEEEAQFYNVRSQPLVVIIQPMY